MTVTQEERFQVVQNAISQIEAIKNTKQERGVKIGYSAEILHVLFFNLNAINDKKSFRAFSDKDNNSPLSRNHPFFDIIVTYEGNSTPLLTAQLKFYKNAVSTLQHVCTVDINSKKLKYTCVDQNLVPCEQIINIVNSLEKKLLKESYRLKNGNTSRIDVLNDIRKILPTIGSQLQLEGVTSKALSLSDIAKFLDSNDEFEEIQKNVRNVNRIEIFESHFYELATQTHNCYGKISIVGGLVGDLVENQIYQRSKANTTASIISNSTSQSLLQISNFKRNQASKKEVIGHIFINCADAVINTKVRNKSGRLLGHSACELAHYLLQSSSDSQNNKKNKCLYGIQNKRK